MAVLITHGYLLTGTGSNLYVNNLVRELVRTGQDVILFCQDSAPDQIDFINEVYHFNASNSQYTLFAEKSTNFTGNCKCFVPNLNGFLPVYVYDHYDGYEVKEFNSCSDLEVQRYVDQNYKAMDVVLQNHQVTVLNTNHLVMISYVGKLLKEQHDFKFVITVHGSALNFTVKKDKRFESFAKESLNAVDEIVVDSLHADQEMKEFLESVNMEQLIPKMEIIPAGVDVDSFEITSETKNVLRDRFINSVNEVVAKSSGRSMNQTNKILAADFQKENINQTVKEVREMYDYRDIDRDLVSKMSQVDLSADNVFFVGKYLWTKGIYLLLLAVPEILSKNPNTNFVIAGFGPFREPAEIILNYLARKDVNGLLDLFKNNSLFYGEDKNPLPLAIDILETHGEEIQDFVASYNGDIRKKVVFTGILNHSQLVHLLPAMDVLVAPSVFPEAFGMVAIEAASCGVYPVVTYQSAFKEIADQIKVLAKDQVTIKDVVLDDHAATHIAQNVLSYLIRKEQMTPSEMLTFKASMRKLVVDHYSWEGIAQKYLKTFSA